MCLMAAFVPHRSNKYFHVIASNVRAPGHGDRGFRLMATTISSR
jgi:hypothetical protein